MHVRRLVGRRAMDGPTDPIAPRPRPPLRRRIEGLAWLTRPAIVLDSAFYALCGWFLSSPRATWHLAATLGSVWMARAGGIVMNDVLDYEDDKRTAPQMPLPAGLVSVRAAAALALALMLSAGGLGLAAATTAGGMVGITATYVACFVLAVLYSRFKGSGFPGSLLMSIQVSFPGVVGWVAGGARDAGQFAIVFGALTLFGVRQNLLAGLRDIDTDPLIGLRTTAARLGMERAVAWVLRLTALTSAALLLVAALRGNLAGVGLSVAGAALALASIPGMTRTFRDDELRTRESRSRSLRVLARRSYVTAAAFPVTALPVAGLLAWVLHWTVDAFLSRAYHARVTAGGLTGTGPGQLDATPKVHGVA